MRKEAVELAHSIDRYLDGKDGFTSVMEEIADVLVLSKQLIEHYKMEDDITMLMMYKIDRTINNMEGDDGRNTNDGSGNKKSVSESTVSEEGLRFGLLSNDGGDV